MAGPPGAPADVPVGPDELLVAYGTLASRANVVALLGREVLARRGQVVGWRTVALAGRPYPAVVADPGAVCAVSVLGPVSAGELALVDAWEDEYTRVRVLVRLDAGGSCTGWMWVLAPSADVGLLPAGPWSLAAWEREFLDESCRQARAFRAARAGARRA